MGRVSRKKRESKTSVDAGEKTEISSDFLGSGRYRYNKVNAGSTHRHHVTNVCRPSSGIRGTDEGDIRLRNIVLIII